MVLGRPPLAPGDSALPTKTPCRNAVPHDRRQGRRRRRSTCRWFARPRTTRGSTASSPSATISSLPATAREAIAPFAELRARHDAPAKEAFAEARRLFEQGKQDVGYAKYREIVQSHYASPLYRTVKRWLEERK